MPLLPVHVIIGTGVYARFKTDARPRIGNQGEPLTERTKFGLTILSPGNEFDTTHVLLTQKSQVDYEGLRRLDVLGSGQCKQLVENRVQKIHAPPEITWRHVPTQQNPADLASRGGAVEFRELWWHGPEWMSVSKCWPVQQVIQACETSREEVKVQREVFEVAVDTTDRLDGVLDKFELSKAINICAWISRFLYNSRNPDQKFSGPLTTEEIRKQHIFWLKRVQKSCDKMTTCDLTCNLI